MTLKLQRVYLHLSEKQSDSESNRNIWYLSTPIVQPVTATFDATSARVRDALTTMDLKIYSAHTGKSLNVPYNVNSYLLLNPFHADLVYPS